MSDTIVLCKNLTIVIGIGQSFSLDWVGIPSQYQNWQLTLDVKSIIPASILAVLLQSTWDTDSVMNTTGGAATLNAQGISIAPVTAGVGPMVRLTFSGTATSMLVLSAYLTPKTT